jgi:hypothetical protein
MSRDPIVEEVHRIRRTQVARFNFDLQAMLADLQRRQEAGEFEVVYGVPRKPRRMPKRSEPEGKRSKTGGSRA